MRDKEKHFRAKPEKDLVGQKFGRLTVIEQVDDYVSPKGSRRTRWKCQCSCEKQTILGIFDNSKGNGLEDRQRKNNRS